MLLIVTPVCISFWAASQVDDATSNISIVCEALFMVFLAVRKKLVVVSHLKLHDFELWYILEYI